MGARPGQMEAIAPEARRVLAVPERVGLRAEVRLRLAELAAREPLGLGLVQAPVRASRFGGALAGAILPFEPTPGQTIQESRW